MCTYREYMGTQKYGISLQVFNFKSHKWAQRTSKMLSWTQEEKFRISKQPGIILFII